MTTINYNELFKVNVNVNVNGNVNVMLMLTLYNDKHKL